MRSAGGGNGNGNTGNGNGGRKMGEFDGRKTPIGQQQQQQQQPGPPYQPYSGAWDQQKDPSLRLRTSNPNLRYSYQQQQSSKDQPVPPIPAQYMQPPRPTQQNFGGSPVDVPSLIAAKGYNPATFELRPQYARYFVIKSYTEDDVHKSLKYEIWSSTEPGNKRLDKAFKECNGRGPIYLFFSVNASGHFCGMAEMLTAVDYTRSSTVWASDKWKGVFKVRWIYVRDIPNLNLRHIKLMNTAERKPVTNSRDTQELLAEAGQEMLRIIHTHPARTSLLQDFAFYELQAMQKVAQGSPSPSSPTSSAGAPTHSPQMSPPMAPAQFPLNPNAFMVPQMTPMVQMQLMGMNMGMGAASSQFQAMHQSVMRHPSPGPSGEGFGHNGF
ncbi:unnamed protein product [Mycena citricolor]|uniref:YTH domain-containing protein n=1 Tax=Mycena citricolor TaxID=2018698 RepID=A0AAD2Q5S2_9AGAR|nr:unnamed protein product [Mycena citricolor]